MIHLLLDVNVLGKGFRVEATRTGIFRASEGLLRAMLARNDLALSCSAESSWVSELMLLTYQRERNVPLGDRIIRAWAHSEAAEAEASGLITRILALEATGQSARRERGALMLLNATARRRTLGQFELVHSLRTGLPSSDRVRAQVRALTIHDLVSIFHPEWCYEGAESQMREVLASADPQRDFFIVNSEATAGEVKGFLNLEDSRVFVTPFAADPVLFQPEADLEVIATTRARYGIPDGPYFLSLGTLEPRKNLAHLIRCFFRLIEQEGIEDLNLVLVGPTGWKTEETISAIEGRPDLAGRIVRTGFVKDQDLAAIYSGASVYVFPSLYEGFGLPILEAMRCGTPVITSSGGALGEVAGDAAMVVPPLDADALSDAMFSLLRDEARRMELGRRGKARAAGYSWERTADLTVQAYHAMLAAT